MKTSPTGRAVLSAREGVMLKAYKDSVGVLTIGVGHTGRATPPTVYSGMQITRSDADQILAADLVVFEKAVNAAITKPMTQNQFDAFISLAFNIGSGGFTTSTVVKRFNDGNIVGAADAFLLWKKPAEIISRRQAERSQFLTPYEKALPVARNGEKPIAVPYTPKHETSVSEAPTATVTAPASVPPVAAAPVGVDRGLWSWLQRLVKRI